jgi:tRNA A37 threonylcarbamoyladenosine synthetase subunit TsaC/SUA5/YrdC
MLFISQKKKKKSLIRPDPIGIRTAVALVRHGHPLAMPTECTYEMVLLTSPVTTKHNIDALSPAETTREHQQQPHIYIPADAKVLEKSRLWTKRYTPVKSYGILNKDGSKTIASFNEAVLVLQAISPCIWPGPCCVYFPVARPVVFAKRIRASCPIVLLPNTNDACNGGQQRPQTQHYVKLRSPRHPLAIRMCHELGYNLSRSLALSSCSALNSNSVAASTTTQEDHGNNDKLRTKSNASAGSSVNSSPRGGGGCGSLASSSSSAEKHRLLVGYTLQQQPDGAPVTESSQVPMSSMHALNGEDETYEALRVPTCKEYVSRGSCWIVLDVHRRTIYMSKELVQKPIQHALYHGAAHAPSADAAAAQPVQTAVLRKWKLEYRDKPLAWSS